MRWAFALALLALAGAGKPERTREAGGEHIRLETAKGTVHVWLPARYSAETAGIALYVHGYYTDVNRAWKQHKLAAQFAASGRNALFIAPEAPDGMGQQVFWPELDELLHEVTKQTGLRRPWGPVVAVAHSGGYRTAAAWLDDELVDDLVLLDALYGDEDAFRDWVAAGSPHGLVVVGADTLRWTEPFARETHLVVHDQLPERAEPTAGPPRIYLRAGVAHMDLVRKGRFIPLLYRMTRLPAAAAAR